MWGFDTSGLANSGGGALPSGASGTGLYPTPKGPTFARRKKARASGNGVDRDGAGGDEGGRENGYLGEKTVDEINALQRLRAGDGDLPNGARGGDVGGEKVVLGDPRVDTAEGGGVSSEEGVGSVDGVGSWLGWEAGSDAESEEGRWDRPRDSRGSSSVRRESKTSFHDGVLEVVAVEGVLHLGQIQVGVFGLARFLFRRFVLIAAGRGVRRLASYRTCSCWWSSFIYPPVLVAHQVCSKSTRVITAYAFRDPLSPESL